MELVEYNRKRSILEELIKEKNISNQSPIKLLIENLVNRLPIGMSIKLINFMEEEIIQLAIGMTQYTEEEVEEIHKSGCLTWVESVLEWTVLELCPYTNDSCQDTCNMCLIKRCSKDKVHTSFYYTMKTTPVSMNGVDKLFQSPKVKSIEYKN